MLARPSVPDSAAPADIPRYAGATCSVSAVDTTCKLTVPADTLVEPVIPGHEFMNFPTIAFLVVHRSSGKKILFDLGCRREFWTLPDPISEIIDAKVPGIKVDKDLVDVLKDGGIDVTEISSAVVSHHHYDHIGDPATFPKSMSLIVGPGFSEAFLPGFPTNQNAPVFESAVEGREIQELDFSEGLKVAGYPAVDYFHDGSFYILHSPGHAIGHLSALARTTENSFIFLGGDICHFGGTFRPTEQVPMPALLSPDQVGIQDHLRAPYSSSHFLRCHPCPGRARTTPYYTACCRPDSWYVDPAMARQSIERLKVVDGDDRVLVLIAHDPSTTNTIPLFPNGNLDDWEACGWKSKLRWRFLDELPGEGKKRRYLVDGTYKEDVLVEPLLRASIS
ncbi:beta-lactamase-like protein [Diaporthe sp. PMI_573]|nr:beta-lactamase-like protein [Diaporthaceae sp. PMI_573]